MSNESQPVPEIKDGEDHGTIVVTVPTPIFKFAIMAQCEALITQDFDSIMSVFQHNMMALFRNTGIRVLTFTVADESGDAAEVESDGLHR